MLPRSKRIAKAHEFLSPHSPSSGTSRPENNHALSPVRNHLDVEAAPSVLDNMDSMAAPPATPPLTPARSPSPRVSPDLHATPLPSKATMTAEPLSPEQPSEDGFWERALAGAAKTPLPYAFSPAVDPNPNPQSRLRGSTLPISADFGSTELSAILCSSWAIILSHRTDSQDVVFGLQFSNAGPGLNGRALPMRILVDKGQSTTALLRRVQACSQRILSSSSTLDRISSLSESAREACRFTSLIILNECEDTNLSLPGSVAVALEFELHDKELSMGARYDGQLISRDIIRLVLGDMEHLVWQLLRVERDVHLVGDLEALSPVGRRQILQYNRP